MELRWHINTNLSGAEYAGRYPKQKFTNSVGPIAYGTPLGYQHKPFLSLSAKEVFKNKNKSSQIQYRVWKFTNSVSRLELRWHINTSLFVVEYIGPLQKQKFTNSMCRLWPPLVYQ